MRGISEIQKVNPKLASQIAERGGFLLDTMIPDLIKINRMMMVLVRCGASRFTCPVDCVKHLVGIIDEHRELKQATSGGEIGTDYIRDISLPA